MTITPRNPSSAALLCAASLFAATALVPNLLPAQAAPHAAAPAHTATSHTATAAHTASVAHTAPISQKPGGCIKLPDVSPKVPALPAGAPCPKALYTLSTAPDIHIDYSAPIEGDLAKTLGIEPVSFTLAYVDTRVGAGPLAEPHKYYTVKYTGYLADGSVFDASDKHPETADGFTFQVGEHHVIAGWDTGFAGMKIGGKRRLFIPWQLAYGAQGHPPAIPARAELIFDMELVSQSDSAPAPKAPPAPPAAAAPRPAMPVTPPASSGPATPPPAAATPSAPASAAPATPPPTENK